MDTNWTLLQTFLQVAEAGSFSRAAQRLSLSQPTVGRHIAALEEESGQRLFLRGARGLSLTPAGARLAEAAAAMDQAAAQALRALAVGDAELAGAVRVSATEGLGIHWLTRTIPPLHQRYPGIDIELMVDNFAVNLGRRDADIALRLFRPSQKRLSATRAALLGLALYAARDYISRRGLPDSKDQLPRHHIVGLDESLSQLPSAEWLAAQVGEARYTFRANTLIAQYQAIKAGCGIGMLPCFLAQGDRTFVPILPELNFTTDIWLVVHDDLKDVPRIRATHDFLLERLHAEANHLAGLRT